MAKIDDDAVASGPELARLLGVTPTTVSKLGGDGVLRGAVAGGIGLVRAFGAIEGPHLRQGPGAN